MLIYSKFRPDYKNKIHNILYKKSRKKFSLRSLLTFDLIYQVIYATH